MNSPSTEKHDYSPRILSSQWNRTGETLPTFKCQEYHTNSNTLYTRFISMSSFENLYNPSKIKNPIIAKAKNKNFFLLKVYNFKIFVKNIFFSICSTNYFI